MDLKCGYFSDSAWGGSKVQIKVRKIACQSCGADLEVDESIRYVTCAYCTARLEVVHGATTIHSKILEKVVKQQHAVENELKIIRLERYLQRLERQWEQLRVRVSTRGQDGRLEEPGRMMPMTMIMFGIVIGFGLIVGGIESGSPWLFGLLGVGCGFAGVMVGRFGLARAREFERLRQRYARKRSHVRRQIGQLDSGR